MTATDTTVEKPVVKLQQRWAYEPPCQIDQVHFGGCLAGQSALAQPGLQEGQREDSVAARAHVIHVGAGSGAQPVASGHQLLHSNIHVSSTYNRELILTGSRFARHV